MARLLERLLELFTDLMAQLPTRRFFHAVLLDSHVLVHASLSPFGKREAGKLTMQLLGLLDYYERFEVTLTLTLTLTRTLTLTLTLTQP